MKLQRVEYVYIFRKYWQEIKTLNGREFKNQSKNLTIGFRIVNKKKAFVK